MNKKLLKRLDEVDTFPTKNEKIYDPTECAYDGKGNLCKKSLPKHGCDIDMAMPYVNSPRYAECGYGEWDNTHGFSEKEFDKIYDEVEKNG